jgi:hypothetical protein
MKKGLTLNLCIGQWAKPHIHFLRYSWRICLGFIAFTIYFYDHEVSMSDILFERDRLNNIYFG